MKRRRTCIALTHVAFEHLGIIAPALAARGFGVSAVRAGIDPIDEAAWLDAGLVVILGGPISVYEQHAYPWMTRHVDLVRRRLALERPTLGICLGAQMMAAAAGARVYPSGRKEIGWDALTLTDAGRASPLRHLDGVPVLHWHGDTFDLCAGATLLCSTGPTPHQAFALGRHALALQFHAEVQPGEIEAWLVGHAAELAHARVDVGRLRSDSLALGGRAAQAGGAMIAEWLDAAGLAAA